MTKMRGPRIASSLANLSNRKSNLLHCVSQIHHTENRFLLDYANLDLYCTDYIVFNLWIFILMKNQSAMNSKTEYCNTKKTYSCIGNIWVVGSLLNLQSSRHRLEFSFFWASPDFESSFLWPNSSDQPNLYWCFRLHRLENQDSSLLLWTTKDK